jgi:hypothetical protein
MKRWVTMTMSVIAIVGAGYLGEKAYQANQQHDQDVEGRIAALSIQVSDLNDRLIATTRDEKDASPSSSTSAISGLTLSMAQIFPQHWLRQTLQLAQAQLESDQKISSVNAFESSKNTLNLVKSNLNSLVTGHAISELTASGLTRAIDTDLKMIDNQAQTQRQEVQLLDRYIAQLQLTLDTMARQGPSMSLPTTLTQSAVAQGAQVPTTELSFIQRISRLFVIEKPILNVRENMLQRGLICREVALTLGLARQALAQGQSDRVMQLLADSRAQLASVVDPAAKQMQASIAALSVSTQPKLQLTSLQWTPTEALMVPVKSMNEGAAAPVTTVAPAQLVQPQRVVAS